MLHFHPVSLSTTLLPYWALLCYSSNCGYIQLLDSSWPIVNLAIFKQFYNISGICIIKCDTSISHSHRMISHSFNACKSLRVHNTTASSCTNIIILSIKPCPTNVSSICFGCFLTCMINWQINISVLAPLVEVNGTAWIFCFSHWVMACYLAFVL